MNLSKNWGLHIGPDVYKALGELPRHNAEVILKAIAFLATNPYFGDIQKMKGADGVWRRLIGTYRLFYKITAKEKIILVFRIERRNSNTY